MIEIIDYQFQEILKFTDDLGVTRNALSVCLICHCFLHYLGVYNGTVGVYIAERVLRAIIGFGLPQ